MLFQSGEALFDRLNVSLEVPFQCPSREAFLSLIGYWGDRNEMPDPAGARVPLLRLSDARAGRGRAFTVRIAPGWQMRGQGTVRFDETSGRGRLSLALVLNYTRWVARLGLTSLADIELADPERSFREPEEGAAATHRGLDGNDNLLDRVSLGGTVLEGRADRRVRLVDAFAEHLQDLFIRSLMPVDRGGTLPSDILTGISMPAPRLADPVEVYWDLWVANAPATVHRLRCTLQARAPELRWQMATGSPRHIGAGLVSDAPWVSLPLTQDISLKVYAKDLERLRFEITFKDRISQTAGRSGAPGNSLQEKLAGLSSAASERMAGVWRALVPMLTADEEVGDFSDLLTILGRADLGSDGFKLISLLSENRRLTSTNVDSEKLRGLIRLGIVEEPIGLRRGGAKCYPLALRWSKMFDRLQGRSDAPVSAGQG